MHLFSFHNAFPQNQALFPIGLFVFWLSSELLVDHKSKTPVDIHIHLALTEAIKLFVAFGLYSARQKYSRYDSLDPDNEDHPLSNINLPLEGSHESCTPRNVRINELAQIYPRLSRLGGGRSSLSILVISTLYVIRAHMVCPALFHPREITTAPYFSDF
ncbi:hypothetical protein CY34DRAFT_638869 [Suillus luteus UH-Slu-Lm8-n1]|uniref:Unplaced genomic scaffold CY34scaffold_61, whole genome shotgun sequence n=1 Tax=Suillus luteus UH-Slu-Lm8-n1 TaxID=930992 RepID=A0A0D0B2Y8_9AGAM|nr:hypothetical protein CY34DRAFT_638869 [Suillus luteus UH-Slu-Lm8-n1]